MKLAATYVRASTDHQKYSTANQTAALASYSNAHDMQIVRAYSDDGRSGLTLKGRPALRQLLTDVMARPNFECLLVLDVSRWGRFQDVDESAHYEFLCRRAGVKIIYCAEPFLQDGGAADNILKAVKRIMAAEYSRELSLRVSTGKRALATLGFGQGQFPGIGLRRMLISHEGLPKLILQTGERKSLATDRIVFVPGPSEEVALVRRIFRLFAHQKKGCSEIATLLNHEGVPSARGRQWRRRSIELMLTNERYIGHIVYGRTRSYLQGAQEILPETTWIRVRNAFPAIVPVATFERAKSILAVRRERPTDDDFLDPLRALHAREGRITAKLINAEPDMPSARAYKWRFLSLAKACALIGVECGTVPPFIEVRNNERGHTDAKLLSGLTAILKRSGYLTRDLIDASPEVPSSRVYQWRFGGLNKAYSLVGYQPPKTRKRDGISLNITTSIAASHRGG